MNLIDRIMLKLGYIRKPEQREKRMCDICGRQIKRNHHWYHVEKMMRHVDCENPAMPRAVKPDAEQTRLAIDENDKTV